MKAYETLVIVAVGLVFTGCAGMHDRKEAQIAEAHDNMVTSIIARTAFETGCPQDQINATFIDPVTIGVNACGQKLVFVVLPNAAGADCGAPEGWGGNVVDTFPKYCNAVLNSAGALGESSPGGE